eukprot:IDg3505t1
MGNKSTSTAVGYGDVILDIIVDGLHKTCRLNRVLHIPSFAYSLISVGTMAKRGVNCTFDQFGVSLVRNGLVVARGSRTSSDLYALDTIGMLKPHGTAFISSIQLWHERLGMSKGGSKYFVTFIDDKSRFTTVYPMKRNLTVLLTSRSLKHMSKRLVIEKSDL